MTLNTASTVWVARLRQRAQMCKEFSRDRGDTRLATELAEMARELSADAERLERVLGPNHSA